MFDVVQGKQLRVKNWRTVKFEVPVHALHPPRTALPHHSSGAAWRCLALFALSVVLPFASPGAEVRAERWRWSNPLPHGNNVLDMFVTDNLAVQVGDAGTVYVQRENERWAPAVTGVANYLRGAALMGERFIVTGENGCILWSDDGNVFHPAQLSPATDDWFEGVAASAQRAVAAGDNGSIYTSTNGTNWARVTSGTVEWLRGATFGNGIFVAVGEYGTVMRSTDGVSWNPVASGTTAHLNRVRYLTAGSGAGQFFAVGNNGVALSGGGDASGWVSLNSGTTNHLYDVALNNTGLLLVGDQELRFRATGTSTWTNQITALTSNAPPAWIYLSGCGVTNSFLAAGRTGLLVGGSRTNITDEYAWQTVPDYSSHAWLWDLMVQRGGYVAVGDLATILTSLDGILWAREVAPVSSTNTVLLGVGGTTNLLLAVGNAGTVLISRAGLTNLVITNYVGTNIVVTNATVETLGVLWTNLPAFTTNNLQGVAAGDNLYVVTGDLGSLFTSPDGSNWTPRLTLTTNFLSGVTAFPDGWIAAGDRGTLLRSGPDGMNWTDVSPGTTNWLYRVRWAGNQLVAVGQNGVIYTSSHGTNWSLSASGTTRWLNDVAFLDGTWFVAGNQGLLLSSSNLVDWTSLPVPTGKSLFGAAAWDGQLVLAGIEGIVLRNQVVPDLTPMEFLDYDLIVATNTIISMGETNAVPATYELFLVGGEADQFFEFQTSTNLASTAWNMNAALELYDPSGTLYLIRTRPLTNTPPGELYRTRLLP